MNNALVVREKTLKKNNNRIGIVKSAVPHTITVRPNERIEIQGFVDKKLDHISTPAILQETEDASLPSCIDITPSVVQYTYQDKMNVTVSLSNVSTNTVNIEPNAFICEIQPVSISEETIERMQETEMNRKRTNIVNELDLETSSNITGVQQQKLREVLMKHKDIFSTSDTDIGQCNIVKHRIDMPDATPFKQRHRRIPPALQ